MVYDISDLKNEALYHVLVQFLCNSAALVLFSFVLSNHYCQSIVTIPKDNSLYYHLFTDVARVATV